MMEKPKDIRWEQRFSNFRKALHKLNEAIQIVGSERQENNHPVKSDEWVKKMEEVLKEGLIQRFEYTYEMAWNVMKDYAEYQGITEVNGSRDAIRYAFSTHLVSDGELWMDMIKSRVKTSHTYNEETANDIFRKIIDDYHSAFIDFERLMEDKRSGNQGGLFDKE